MLFFLWCVCVNHHKREKKVYRNGPNWNVLLPILINSYLILCTLSVVLTFGRFPFFLLFFIRAVRLGSVK